MTLLPSLTSTRKERIAAFVDDLSRFGVTRIALFPTTLTTAERRALYADLERVEGLKLPHVHLRSDCGDAEIEYLAERFDTEVFNVHPAASATAYVPESSRWLKQIYLENSDVLPEADQLAAFGGVCPDFSHWEAARLADDPAYRGFGALVHKYAPGCCHISAIRTRDPNPWNGRSDHHHFVSVTDLDYLARYRGFLPGTWASLELENPLEEQLAAIAYLTAVLDL